MREARAELGDLWGLDRHLTIAELGRVLRMRGDSAADMVLDFERGKRQPTGPVTLALELMLEPPEERIDEAMEALCDLSAEPHRETLGQFLQHHFGEESRALLEEIVLTVSDIIRRPTGAEEAVAVTRFHNRDRRHIGAIRTPSARRRRRA